MKKIGNLFRELKILLLNELNAPELLPYGYDIIIFIKELINYQSILMAIQNSKYKSSELALFLKKMEIDRLEYMVRTYHRIRLLKIESSLIKSNGNPFKTSRFIIPECKYLLSFLKLYKKYLNNFFLKFFSVKLKTLIRYDIKIFNKRTKNVKIKYAFFKLLEKRNLYEKYTEFIGIKNTSHETGFYCTEYKRIRQLLYAGLISLL